MFTIFNPLAYQDDLEIRPGKSFIYFFMLAFAIITLIGQYIKNEEDIVNSILLYVAVVYLLAALIYIYNTVEKLNSELIRRESELEQLRKQVKELNR